MLPKVIALAIALPLVTFCTDLAALAGGLLVSRFTLGIPPQAFLEALPRAVETVNFWIGIGKAGTFGFAVAFVACHYGLQACCRIPTASPPASPARSLRPSPA